MLPGSASAPTAALALESAGVPLGARVSCPPEPWRSWRTRATFAAAAGGAALIAGRSDGEGARYFAIYKENLERFARGQPLRHTVDKQKGY